MDGYRFGLGGGEYRVIFITQNLQQRKTYQLIASKAFGFLYVSETGPSLSIRQPVLWGKFYYIFGNFFSEISTKDNKISL